MEPEIVYAYLVVINVAALFMCAYDKRAAIKKRRRISEKALFFVSVLGGALGMFVGMLFARHKTRHWYFMVFVPLLTVLHILLLVWLL